MKMMLASAVLAGVVLALAASAGGLLTRGHSAAQEAVTIGVDVDPTGNTATSLGAIDSCLSVNTGDTFQVDVFIDDVTDLLAWEAYFTYDTAIVNILERDVMMFQAANAGSNVFDVSEALPDIDGWYGVATVDIAEPPAPDSGSGVLARLTLKAVGAGVSPASLSPIDVNGDGRLDFGPFLKDIEAESIDDLDGDGFFDGPIANAQIAVDTACPESTPAASPTAHTASPSPTTTISPTPEQPAGSPTPDATPPLSQTVTLTPPAATRTPSSPTATETEGTAWTGGPAIIGYILGGSAIVLLGGGALLAIRRRRAR